MRVKRGDVTESEMTTISEQKNMCERVNSASLLVGALLVIFIVLFLLMCLSNSYSLKLYLYTIF